MKVLERVFLTGILCVMLVGFGVCGAYGTVGGLSVALSDRWDNGLLATAFGVTGLAIAWLCLMAIASLWRKRPTSGE